MQDSNPSASSPAQQPGDGNSQRSSTAQNVSEDGAVAMFLKMEQASAKKSEVAATDAKEVPEAQAETGTTEEGGETKQTAAEDAQQADSPEAETEQESEDSEPSSDDGKEAESEDEGKEKADEVLSKEQSNLDDKTRQKIQKRIDREVGKRKALETQLKQLTEKLNSVTQSPPQPAATQQAAPVVPVGNAPLPEIKDMAGLVDYAKKAKETKEWAEEVLDRDDIDQGVQIGDKTYTKGDIKAVLRNARKALEDTIPSQKEYFNQVGQFVNHKQNVTKLAHEKFPFLTDRNSEEYKAAQAMYQQSPWLHNLAASEMFIGAYLKGMKTLAADRKSVV